MIHESVSIKLMDVNFFWTAIVTFFTRYRFDYNETNIANIHKTHIILLSL